MNWMQGFFRLVKDRRDLVAEIDRLKAKALDWEAPPIESFLLDWKTLHNFVTNQTGLTLDRMLDENYAVPQLAFWTELEKWAYENIGSRYDRATGFICADLAFFVIVAAKMVNPQVPIGFATVITERQIPHMCNLIVYHHKGELRMGHLDSTPREIFAGPPPRGIIPVDFFPLIEEIRI